MPEVKITNVELHNFKGFRHHNLALRDKNVLVGANNSGKSTLISCFRILEIALRKARSRKPERVIVSGSPVKGYEIDLDELDVSTENVHTEYDEVESSALFRFSNGNSLRLVFPARGGCYLIPEAPNSVVASPSGFERLFPVPLIVVPVLGPLEHNEPLVKATTVQKNLSSARACRNFRNYWYYHPDGFPKFQQAIRDTWPGMEVCRPEEAGDVVQMYCLENRMTRELYWAGFGFQIWCQLLSFLSRAPEGSLVVIDEPEVYLHPDVQRQIPRLLDKLGLRSIMATHSTEIISESEPNEIVLVDKKSLSSSRLKEVKQIQVVLEEIGSVQNLVLSRLARHGRVLFFEGQDIKLLQRLGRQAKIDISDLAGHVSVIEIGGFQNWKKIRDLAWGLNKLTLKMHIGAVLDRDYFADTELDEVEATLSKEIDFVHILSRKELENYLLEPSILQRAITTEMQRRKRAIEPPNIEWIERALSELTADLRHSTLGQFTAQALMAEKSSRKDSAVIISETSHSFEARWIHLKDRLSIARTRDIRCELDGGGYRQVIHKRDDSYRNVATADQNIDFPDGLERRGHFKTRGLLPAHLDLNTIYIQHHCAHMQI